MDQYTKKCRYRATRTISVPFPPNVIRAYRDTLVRVQYATQRTDTHCCVKRPLRNTPDEVHRALRLRVPRQPIDESLRSSEKRFGVLLYTNTSLVSMYALLACRLGRARTYASLDMARFHGRRRIACRSRSLIKKRPSPLRCRSYASVLLKHCADLWIVYAAVFELIEMLLGPTRKHQHR